MSTESYNVLAKVIKKLTSRFSLLFFSKLMLYEPETLDQDDTVRHYDL